MMTVDKDELKCLEKTEKDDVSNLMKKRISLNYGLQVSDFCPYLCCMFTYVIYVIKCINVLF